MMKSVLIHHVQKAVKAMLIVKQATTLAFALACQGTWEILLWKVAKVSRVKRNMSGTLDIISLYAGLGCVNSG